jgi:hypothetical protein
LKNSTLLTVPGDVSAALALIVMLAGAVNVAPVDGELMLTVGGVFAELTVTVTVEDVVVAFSLSVAFAVNE